MATDLSPPPDRVTPAAARRPIRVLELRSAEGPGGGPEKTILHGAARTDPARFAVTVCYIRPAWDACPDVSVRALRLGLDYVEIRQRRLLDGGVLRAARRLVRDRHIDLVHAHDYKTDLLALLLARLERVVPLATAHGWTGHSRRERLVYYPADRRLLAAFPLVIAVSGQIRAELLRAGARPERVRTVLNGIDRRAYRRDPARRAAARAALGLGPEDVVIGSVGRLEPQKRFDVLLEACAALRDRRPGLRLMIAGEGSQRATLEAAVRRLGLADACRLLGHHADVVGLHHALDLFVQSSDYEGTPNVVLEAMALETPVVATEVGGTADLLADGVHGLLVPPREPAALAQAIHQALADPPATARRVAAARRRVETDLSFEARMQAVEAAYDELAAKVLSAEC